ncbi:MAG: glycosyl hydrolase [Deltaproteobacteria bacterium]|nr:glycosyl hydrolase [Deltaproteobacteria bacterium]
MGVLHIQGAEWMAGFRADSTLSFQDLPTAELLARLRKLLDLKLHGLCFSAYQEGQGPELQSVLSEDQVRARLARIAPYTRWIRTFSCIEGNEHAPRLAREWGLRTLVGAWIGEDREKNAAEIAAVVEVARAGHADRVAVGNEVLLRGEMSEEELVGLLHQVKAALPGVPVATVDAYFLFPQHPALVDACDFLPINCYPFWEKVPLERSPAYAEEMVRRVQAVSAGRPILIAETGWPSAGSPVGDAVPSLRNMALYALNLITWADRLEMDMFWFSAFDEAWKFGPEGDCGAYWGLWDSRGSLKIAE